MISRGSLWNKLKRGRETRARFVESHLDKMLAYQIRALREEKRWTQAQFAEKVGVNHPNNVSARLENPQYGKHTLTTLKKIAAACDVGLVVWFIPFSRLVDWATGTLYSDEGLRPSFYNIPEFDKDQLLPAIPDAAFSSKNAALSGVGEGGRRSKEKTENKPSVTGQQLAAIGKTPSPSQDKHNIPEELKALAASIAGGGLDNERCLDSSR